MTDALGMASEDDEFYVTEWENCYDDLNSVKPDALTSTVVLEFIPCNRPKDQVDWKLWGTLLLLLVALIVFPSTNTHIPSFKWLSSTSGMSRNLPPTHPPEADAPRLPERIPPAPAIPTLEKYVDQVIEVIDTLEAAQDKLEGMATQLLPPTGEWYNFADPSIGGSIMWYLTDWNMFQRLLWHRLRHQFKAHPWNDPKNTLLANDKLWRCDSEYCALAILTIPMKPKKIVIELDPQASSLSDIAVCALPQDYRKRSYRENNELQCSLPLLAPQSDAIPLAGWQKVLQRRLQPSVTKFELFIPQSFQRLDAAYDGFYLELKARSRILVLRVSILGVPPDESTPPNYNHVSIADNTPL